MVSSAIGLICEKSDIQAFKKAHRYAVITAGVVFVGELLTWVGYNNEMSAYQPIIFAVVQLLFIYYLMDGSIEHLHTIGDESSASEYQGKLSAYIVVFVINTVIECVAIATGDGGLIFISVIVGIALILWLIGIMRNSMNIML